MTLEASELMPDLQREAILAEARPFDPLTSLADFERRFPNAMRILRIGGVHPTEGAKMDNPYLHQPDDESFANVGEHCLAVACFAESIAQRLQERGIFTQAEADWVIQRALVHDGNKRLEVFRKKALRAGIIKDAYSPQAYETIRPILLAQDIDQATVEYMARAGAETSHLSIASFLRLEDGIPSLTPGRMIDKIVHLADDCTSTSIPEKGEKPLTVYLTPWERMVASEFPTRYSFLWREGLGFNPAGEVVVIPDITAADRNLRWVRSYACYQPFVSNLICREIQAMIDPANARRPEYFVKDLVNKALIKPAQE